MSEICHYFALPCEWRAWLCLKVATDIKIPVGSLDNPLVETVVYEFVFILVF